MAACLLLLLLLSRDMAPSAAACTAVGSFVIMRCLPSVRTKGEWYLVAYHYEQQHVVIIFVHVYCMRGYAPGVRVLVQMVSELYILVLLHASLPLYGCPDTRCTCVLAGPSTYLVDTHWTTAAVSEPLYCCTTGAWRSTMFKHSARRQMLR